MTQTDFATKIANTIKDLLSDFDDKHSKQDSKFKETIVEQDAKFDTKPENQLQTLSLHIK